MYLHTNISTTDVEGYKRRYGFLWRTGRFLIQSRGFLEALGVGDTDNANNRQEKQTFDQVLQSGIARIKVWFNSETLTHVLLLIVFYVSSGCSDVRFSEKQKHESNHSISITAFKQQ